MGNTLQEKRNCLKWNLIVKFSHYINQSEREDCVTTWIKFLGRCAHLNIAANKTLILGSFFLWWMTFSAKGFTEITELDCSLVISAGDAMQFSSTEIVATQSCAAITVTLMHTGKLPASGMGHNFFLFKFNIRYFHRRFKLIFLLFLSFFSVFLFDIPIDNVR